MATYRKRKSGVYTEVRKKGVIRRKTLRNMTAARKWANELEARIDEGKHRLEDHTLHEALDRYLAEVSPSHKGYDKERTRLTKMKTELPDVQLCDAHPYIFADWRDRMLDIKGESSVRRELTMLSSVLNVARREWGWMEANPLADIRKPRKGEPRTQLITPDHRRMLCEAAGYTPGQNCITLRQYSCAALELGCTTGMRLSEMTGLKWSDIDQNIARLHDTKNRTTREVPLSRAALKVLDGLRDNESGPFPVRPYSMGAMFARMKNEIGLNHIRFHDSRATAITNLAHKLPINTVARISGHKDLSTLQGYYRKSMSDIANELD